MEQNRLRSPVVWAAVVAQVLAILALIGVIGEGMSNAIRTVATGALELLVLFGVLNDPTDKWSFNF